MPPPAIWIRALLLFASTIAAIDAQTVDDYKVTMLPGVDAGALNFTQYAGHIEITPETHGNLFFWMIQSEMAESQKLVIWLNGGPGCSSMDGLFMGNGPYRVNRNLSLNVTATGWQQYATIVFLDQPVGTGFSMVDVSGYMNNMVEITDEFIQFLDKFFAMFPDLEEKELYLAGESFAGTYIPYFASRMLDLNRNGGKKYQLQGIAIGNGWISPKHQYGAYVDFAYNRGLVPPDSQDSVDAAFQKCQKLLKHTDTVKIDDCEMVLEAIVDATVYEHHGSKYCVNLYDARLTSLVEDGCGMAWPEDVDAMKTYLQAPELVSAVHADKFTTGWTECARRVGEKLHGDKSEPSSNLLPGILEEIPVLLFSGDQDLICNTLGTSYMAGNMTWNGARGFQGAETFDWYIGDTQAGTYVKARNLSLVTIYSGSHMVAYDKPVEALDMMNRFMGVGDNRVNGVPSRIVGDQQDDRYRSTELSYPTSSPGNNGSYSDSSEPGNQPQNDWSRYYGLGTLALIFVICFAAVSGYCWFRSQKPTFQGYSRPGSHGPIPGIVVGLFRNKRRGSRGPKLRLDDVNDTNELDELVIETPTLFTAEGYSDDDDEEQGQQQQRQHYKDGATTATATTENTSRKKHIPVRFAIEDEDDIDGDNNNAAIRKGYP